MVLSSAQSKTLQYKVLVVTKSSILISKIQDVFHRNDVSLIEINYPKIQTDLLKRGRLDPSGGSWWKLV